MSCRVLHRGVEEALLAQVAFEAEIADLEQAPLGGIEDFFYFLGGFKLDANLPFNVEGFFLVLVHRLG